MSLLKSGRRHRLPNKFTPVNKRLNFDLLNNSGAGLNSSTASSTNILPTCDSTQFDMELEEDVLMMSDSSTTTSPACVGKSTVKSTTTVVAAGDDTFSPCRTRSGCVYESGMKKRKFRTQSSKKKLKSAGPKVVNLPDLPVVESSRRSRMASGQSGTGSVADCSENGSETSDTDNLHLGDTICDRLGYITKISAMTTTTTGPYGDHCLLSPPRGGGVHAGLMAHHSARFSQPRERKYRHDIPSSPIHNNPTGIGGGLDNNNELLSSPVMKHWTMDGPHSPTLSFSPPTNNMRAMRLFDGGLTSPNTACAALLTSPRSTPRLQTLKSRLNFGDDCEHRRASLPNPQIHECDTTTGSAGGGGSARKTANINPFTPAAMLLASKKRSRTKRSLDSSVGSSREELQASLDSLEGSHLEDKEDIGLEDEDSDGYEDTMEDNTSQAKRIRVADINITRYELEFLELEEIATGQFGVVKKSRHCLDGIVYAIKISKKPLRNNSHDEKMAMNEVFAHAAMMKHKHVVRYYNSWVERGQVYIQNEYCEGGSLHNKIQEFRQTGAKFSEQELKKIIIHVSKGLQYIHSKQLVHLDIKPANIFISLEYSAPSPNAKADSNSTDSGAASGGFSPNLHFRLLNPATMDHIMETPGRGSGVGGVPTSGVSGNNTSGGGGAGSGSSSCSPNGEAEKVHYKIGDLGHVASVWGGFMAPEEGDCRYMAPELLLMEPERTLLPKADIFSLGLTMFEAASLFHLPRNSGDGPLYERLKRGDLPYLEHYSKEFNNLLKSMVHPDPLARPTASKLLTNSSLNPSMNKSRSQLYKELKEYKEKVAMLELQIATSSGGSDNSGGGGGGHPINNSRPATRFTKLGMDKENDIPPGGGIQGGPKMPVKRLVGRGTTRSTSCLM